MSMGLTMVNRGSLTILYRFTSFDVVKNPTNRPPGLCFMQVICTADVPVPALSISTGQKLSFGRTVPVATELRALLPHTTAPYHGFQDAETGRLVGGGEFYETFAEAMRSAEGLKQWVNYINLVPAS
jgi:hypothetical protein